MKKLWMVILLIACMVIPASAFQPAEWEWTCNTETNLAGYKIYWGGLTGTYINHVDTGPIAPDTDGKCVFTMVSPPAGENFYAATAYDTDGFESDYSNEVVYRSKLTPPGQLKKR